MIDKMTACSKAFVAVLLSLCYATLLAACSHGDSTSGGRVELIAERGTLLVGTTGDYRPLSCIGALALRWPRKLPVTLA